MAIRHGKTAGVILAGFNASPFFNSFESARTIDTHETTPFESDAKTYFAGLNDGTISLSGFYDTGATGVGGDELLDALLQTDNDFPASVFLDGGVVVGRACRMAAVNQSSYNISAPVGDMVTTKADLTVDGGVRYGKCINGKTQFSSSVVTGAACDYGTTDFNSSVGGWVNIHPIENTRSTNINIKVQHSADNSVWVDTATVFVAGGSLVGSTTATTGTNLRYVRALITPSAGTGNATVVVAFARNAG